MKMNIDYIWRINEIDVFYTNETIGGGHIFGVECLQIIDEWYGKDTMHLNGVLVQDFIGYGLVATGLAKNIVFNEIFEPAIEMCRKTKYSENGLNSKIYTQE